jgi:DNA polymerase I-like protein with 3'-5' exonuclease and polymerase domains
MKKESQQIASLSDLQRRVPSLIRAINADEQLAVAAAANPVFAIEELGFTISTELLPTLIRRIRFPLEIFNRLESLAAQIHKLANQRFDVDSPVELERVLFDELKLPRPEDQYAERSMAIQPTTVIQDKITAPLPYSMKKPESKPIDPLEKLRGLHPVIEPLLEYRRLDATTPRLVTREAYRNIRSGEVKLPLKRLRASLKRGPTPE